MRDILIDYYKKYEICVLVEYFGKLKIMNM